LAEQIPLEMVVQAAAIMVTALMVVVLVPLVKEMMEVVELPAKRS